MCVWERDRDREREVVYIDKFIKYSIIYLSMYRFFKRIPTSFWQIQFNVCYQFLGLSVKIVDSSNWENNV